MTPITLESGNYTILTEVEFGSYQNAHGLYLLERDRVDALRELNRDLNSHCEKLQGERDAAGTSVEAHYQEYLLERDTAAALRVHIRALEDERNSAKTNVEAHYQDLVKARAALNEERQLREKWQTECHRLNTELAAVNRKALLSGIGDSEFSVFSEASDAWHLHSKQIEDLRIELHQLRLEVVKFKRAPQPASSDAEEVFGDDSTWQALNQHSKQIDSLRDSLNQLRQECSEHGTAIHQHTMGGLSKRRKVTKR